MNTPSGTESAHVRLLVMTTGFMAILMIDGWSQHVQWLGRMFAIAVLLGGIGCIVAARVRAARRDRVAGGSAPRRPDPD